ncbi:MAG: hypothetical protein H0W81_01510 [Chloroflexi bacterium]|nr:hypothetical protein [Chloroflexota bacterium]
MTDQVLQKRVRLFIFEHFLEHAAPPVAEQVMNEFSLSRSAATDILRDLEAARHIALVKGTARILMAFPFSAIATPFRVTAHIRSYFANCAWDAIAFHAMLGGIDVRVDSFCHHCAQPIRVELRDGDTTHVDPPESLVYLALRPTEWWGDIITTCSNTMVFFASPEHRDASDLCTLEDQAASLTPDQIHTLSGPIYAGKFTLGYARPTKEELFAHFAAMGLTGQYWTL